MQTRVIDGIEINQNGSKIIVNIGSDTLTTKTMLELSLFVKNDMF